MNIEVEDATAIALNRAIEEGNLVRDAFLCRLLIFLRSTEALLNYLEVPHQVPATIHLDRRAIGLEAMPTSPLEAMEAVRDDPLYYVRNYVRENWDCGIYMVQLPRSLDWAACFIEDKDVPGTRAFKLEERATAELYEAFETTALECSNTASRRGEKE